MLVFLSETCVQKGGMELARKLYKSAGDNSASLCSSAFSVLWLALQEGEGDQHRH